MENQPRDARATFDAEYRHAVDDQRGAVFAEFWRTSALHSGSVASRTNDVQADPEGQLALFDLAERDALGSMDEVERGNGARGASAAEAAGLVDTGSPTGADRALLGALEDALAAARAAGDARPTPAVLAALLGELSPPPTPASAIELSLRRARDAWLNRLEAQRRSESTLVGYRVAIDDLLDWSETNDRDVLEEAGIVDYLRSYQERAHPAESTYYRRFVLLRRFMRWVSGRHGLPDPFHDLDAPPKPRQESEWLTPAEFRRLLNAAGQPKRNLPGLAERDQLVLLALVLTGLRRSELCALDWRDLDLDGRKPSLLVRSGKGGKSRRQPIPASLARQLQRLANAHNPELPIRSSAVSKADGCGRRSSPTSSRAPRCVRASRSTSRPTRCATRLRLGSARSSATRASSPSTSATPTSRPSHATHTSTARSCSRRQVASSSSPFPRTTHERRPTSSRLQRPLRRTSSRRSATSQSSPIGRAVDVDVVMDGLAANAPQPGIGEPSHLVAVAPPGPAERRISPSAGIDTKRGLPLPHFAVDKQPSQMSRFLIKGAAIDARFLSAVASRGWRLAHRALDAINRRMKNPHEQ
jgi:integrase